MATLTIYYDYTCQYSYRAMHWMDRVRAARPGLEIEWATFSLKEVNKTPDEVSYLTASSPPSVSVLAQALAHAAREADFDAYHRALFEAMQGEGRHVGDEELLEFARAAGVDVDAFDKDRGRWVASVGAEHKEAVARWGVYGTPTLILDGAAAFVRLREVPGSDAASLLDSLGGIAGSSADLAEIFRPSGPKPTPIQIDKIGRDG